MAQLIINPSRNEVCKLQKEVNFIDFSIIGFQINKVGSLVANLYFLFFDENRDYYVIKNSYLLNRPDDDMAYFNHPIHTILNMRKFTGPVKDKVDKLFSEFNNTNSFYSDFRPVEFEENGVVVDLVQINIGGFTNIKKAHLRMGDFLKIQNITNSITFHRPINSSIDRDKSYYDCEIIKDLEVNYVGSQCMNSEAGEFFAFFSLSKIDSIKKVGVAVPVVTNKKNILVNTTKMDITSFGTLYKENYMVDASKLLMLPVIEDSKLIYKIAINILIAKAKRKLFVTNETITESKLFNPLKLMFSE